ncbi:hypothetical protein CBR_g22846 [Chara braunii]|uniref:Reverse transcriptase RNase H-like domain-containing protein n=1 Tax=Chara braunii TaxID=69332 RepID=A0A388L2T7_CHABU|nr:hypothetical protein CBR_g22846 [Chara braunii]|eukprot:GBG76630.1 hypothetical protein CBR_g22846 [Chara braunii]
MYVNDDFDTSLEIYLRQVGAMEAYVKSLFQHSFLLFRWCIQNDGMPIQTSESVFTHTGTSTSPYTAEQEAKAAAILKERREKEAKKKALLEVHAAKLKKIEEEMAREKERLKKEEEAKLKEVEEEGVVEEEPLERRGRGNRGESSGPNEDLMENKISEWVAGLTLGEDEEALMYVPRDEQEAAVREWEAEGDPLKRQVLEDEKRMEWKFRLTRERKRRMEAATEAAKELEEIRKQRDQMAVQVDLLGKVEILTKNVERLAKVQEEQLLFGRDPIVSILADNRTMRVEEYVEGVHAYFRLEKDGKVEKVLHSLTVLVEDSLPFDIVLGMDWGEAARATLHLREQECRLPSPSGGVKTACLFHASGVDNSLAHCCLSAPAFAGLVKKEQLEEQVFVAYVRPVIEPKEEKPIDPAIAKLLEEFTDLAKLPTGVVPRPIQHRIEIEPGSRTPKGAMYRMSPRELEELRKQLDELLEKGWIRPNSSPFGALVLFVPKKEGKLIMCIDYRGLNAITVLEKLREANFKINAKKSEWAKTQVLYLGHVLDGDGIKPEDSKIAAIRDWPTPRTLTELRSFLDLANYYRKFVRNFSTIAAPLRRLLRKETIWKWDKDCTSAMKKLKQALIEYPVLKVVDLSLPFVVTTDASQYGIGVVLQQDDGNGYRPVEFMSARMPSEKVATSTYERELYALRQALEHWNHYLLGRHFKVYSDHEMLRWLKTQAKMTPKLTRWAAKIDQYDLELKPVKGKYNVVANA